MAKKLKEGYSVSGREKWSYASFFFGQNLFFALVALNVHAFFNDIGMTAVTVAGVLFVSRLFDAINDPFIGIIIDKFRFKNGRFMPWLRISVPLVALTSMFIFMLSSDLSPAMQVFWAILGYALWSISYTISDIPIYGLPMSMTENIKERSGILALGRYIATVGVMLGGILLPAFQLRLGWHGVAILFILLSVLTMIPLVIVGKERHVVRPEKSLTLKQMSKFLVGNKFLLVFYIAMFINLMTNFSQILNIFFARHNMGNQDFASMLGLMAIIPVILVGGFVPLILKRVDKYHVYFISLLAATLIGILRFFVGYSSVPALFALAALHGLAAGISGILVFMFAPDCLEYGTYHTGERSEGVALSIQTFFNKLSGSVAGPLAMLIIGAFGFVEGEFAVQPESALNAIWLTMTLLSALGTGIAAIIIRFYTLREKDVQVMAKYNNEEITKEEAEAVLASKYGPAAMLAKVKTTEG